MAQKQQEQEPKTLGERVVNHLKERLSLKTMGKEAYEGLTDRLIPQGAAELAQALFNGQGYVPYGQGQEPIDPIAPQFGVHGEKEKPNLLDKAREEANTKQQGKGRERGD